MQKNTIMKKMTTKGVSTPQKDENLSKAGQWLKANPGGWFVINDMKAVMK